VLATRIAAQYGWNEQEIARLILESAEEPEPERAYSERLFSLVEVPDLNYVAERLSYVLGRYIRIGVARWFVFEELFADDDRVELIGTTRAYGADVMNDESVPRVVPVPRSDRRVRAVLQSGEALLSVRGATTPEATAAATALEIATGIERKGYISTHHEGSGFGVALAFAPQSLFMLDLLTARFVQARLMERNLTVAKFHVADSKNEEGETRPQLRAVRFEGSHLLDSPPACKLLADGRALVDMALTVQLPPRPDGESGRVPVRVAIEGDHVLVMTGLGLTPSLAYDVHNTVVYETVSEIRDGVLDPGGLEDYAERIHARAQATEVIEVADMLTDEDADSTT
jgi:hypothetical protein